MSYFLKNSDGFTLIEVMIAAVILAAGILALATMQIVSIRSNAFSSEMTYTSMLAQQKLEELKNLPSNDVKLEAGNHPDGTEDETWYEEKDNRGFTYEISHDVQNDIPAENMTRISMTIQWQGSAPGQPSFTHSATFTTILKP
jgi:type IV pilus assembly protein PilV